MIGKVHYGIVKNTNRINLLFSQKHTWRHHWKPWGPLNYFLKESTWIQEGRLVGTIPLTFKTVLILPKAPSFLAIQKYSPSCFFFTLTISKTEFPFDRRTSSGSFLFGPPIQIRSGGGRPVAWHLKKTRSPSFTVRNRGRMETCGVMIAVKKKNY